MATKVITGKCRASFVHIFEPQSIGALTQEQRELLEAHGTALAKLDAIARREDFAAGFQMGARIMAAILDSETHDTRPGSGQ